MNPRSALKEVFTGPGGLTRLVTAGLVCATVAAQHPGAAFDRVLRRDSTGVVLPNWRFFAPYPATHDMHFLYRTLDREGETSKWRPVELISDRKPHQILWFPRRRGEKAVFDISNDLFSTLGKGNDIVVTTPSYRLVRAFLRDWIEREGAEGVEGFQFTIAKSSGFDESTTPEVQFVSPYIPLKEADGTRKKERV